MIRKKQLGRRKGESVVQGETLSKATAKGKGACWREGKGDGRGTEKEDMGEGTSDLMSHSVFELLPQQHWETNEEL